MRNVLAIAILTIFAAGCGWPSFTGTYEGPFLTKATCGTEELAFSAETTLTIEDNGLTLTMSTSDCSGLTADIEGHKATLREKTCPATTSENGVTTTVTYTGGTLTLVEDSLAIDFTANVRLEANGNSQTCAGRVTGTLTQQ